MTGDPAPERAWEYAKTYFDEAAEQSFGIVERLWFEARLRKHLDGTVSDDTGWFALRNAVWALGARLSISKTSTYGQTLSKSWLFFENALVSLFVPVYSFIAQFIHILQCDAAHAQSELDILDLALGYFANLKYATDGLVFLPFAKELASIASAYVDQQRNKPLKPSMDDSILEASQCGLAIEDETANIYDNADSSLLLEEASFEGWDSLLPSLTTWDTVL
ncbi:hypothetical protein ACQRIU_006294 [Beauveria bassiana]